MLTSRSIASRLIIIITLSSAVIFAASIGYIYYHSRVALIKETEEDAKNLVLVSVNSIETVLTSIDKVTEGVARSLETASYSRKSLDELLYGTLAANNDVFGIGTAVEPDESNIAAHYFIRKNGKIEFFAGSESFNYHIYDWYLIPKVLRQKIWSEPYFDSVEGKTVMTTCAVPFFDGTGEQKRLRGMVGSDVSLNRLTKMVASIKVLKTGYALLISQNGTFLTHPNKDFIMNESVFSLAESRKMPALREIGRKMIRGESDFLPYTDSRGVNTWMYYAPVPSTGWTLAVVFPAAELFADLHLLSITAGCIGLAGIILLALVVAKIARSITTPLHELAEATEVIASGNFEAELPEAQSDDEVGKLTRSFIAMNRSLKEYIKNLTETTAAKERIQSELRVATDIQLSLLPHIFPPFPHRPEFEIFASMDPAKEVGGDFYDFFFIDDRNLCFLIADVADKGVPAALYMMVAKTLLRSEGQRFGEPDSILSCVNNILAADNESCMFATVFCAILDTGTGVVRYANAGHNPPLLVESGVARYLDPKPGFVLGPMPDIAFEADHINLRPGDTLFLFTDGVTEAQNCRQEQFGEDELLDALQLVVQEEPVEMIRVIRGKLSRYVDGAPQSDDITMLAIRYLGPVAETI